MKKAIQNPDLLRDRVILVTGTADTLGRAVAQACAQHGATVILSDLNQADIEPAYDACEAAGALQPAILPLDLEQAKATDFIAAADTLGGEFGRLDGLVHCAAFAPYLSRIDDYDVAEWERVLRVNLTSPFLLTQACLPLLRAAAEASVVFTSDRVGRCGLAYWGAFAVSKSGLGTLAAIWADECEQDGKPRFHVVVPGPVATPQRAASHPAENRAALPSPETVAVAYLRILAPEGRALGAAPVSIVT